MMISVSCEYDVRKNFQINIEMINLKIVSSAKIPKMPKAGSSIMHSEKILGVLKCTDTSGVTIQEIAVQANINRITASKYLAVLEAQDAVHFRRVGKAKLYSIKSGYGS